MRVCLQKNILGSVLGIPGILKHIAAEIIDSALVCE